MAMTSALLQFKQSFQISEEYFSFLCDGASFPKTESWNESRDCCSWDGVTCDLLNGHVIRLDLSCSQLVGNFHPNSSLFQLHHLQTLNLAYNWFYPSSIPHNIGQLRNLRHLNLSNASFDRKIPTEISYLSNLVSLDLSNGFGLQLDERTFETMLHNFTNLEVLSLFYVNISSPIPVNISSSLRYLDLSYTNLRGVLTESFFLLPNLETLKLGNNDLLKGVFPKIHQSNTLLMELDISYTGISGELPDSIGTFSSLNILSLYGCQFSGSIPDSIGNLTQITELWFSSNRFTGHIPSTISKLKHLTSLDLSDNSFSASALLQFKQSFKVKSEYSSCYTSFPKTKSWNESRDCCTWDGVTCDMLNGKIPTEISYLSNLVSLHLSNGYGLELDERTFETMLQNFSNLEVLSLFHVNISSPIPVNISSSLRYLDLSYTNLRGVLIESFFLPSNSLETLKLSDNDLLKGVFPKIHQSNTLLMELDISSTGISGELPHSIGTFSSLNISNLQELRSIYLYHNNFIGPFPASILNLTHLEFLDMSTNSLSGPLPSKEPSWICHTTH
ncbi:receptor-like protein 12 [Solanum tuberosum]|uniref:receptor-like protein 12 n=1 Tax=Solanum tuberosum TaxID=4113 RepID=UPI00073A20BB|nr:PREDICTED: receptor-like protein 12 [Solanum tuberosum]